MDNVDVHLVGALGRLIAHSQNDSELAQEPDLQEAIEKLFEAVGLRMPLFRATGRGGTTKVIRFQDEARWLLAASRTDRRRHCEDYERSSLSTSRRTRTPCSSRGCTRPG